MYCRKRAANCRDPFVAEELRRLADCFERTAEAAQVAVDVSQNLNSQSQGSL